MTSQIVVLDRDGCVVSANASWRSFAKQGDTDAWYGAGCGEARFGRSFFEVCQSTTSVSKEIALEVADRVGRVLKGTLPVYTFEYPCNTATQQRWFGVTVTPLEGPDGGVVICQTDITDNKRSEHKLGQNERILRSLIDALPDLIWLKDPQGVYLSCNTRFERFFGAYETQIIGKTDYDFVAADVADAFREHDRAVMEAGEPGTNLEWVSFANDGHVELLQTLKTPIFNADHSLKGILGIGHDVTEITAGHDALRANALFLNTLLEALP
ncbi:MAG: PAS domain-containing protein, partial [Rhodoferax sp.]|nr:PAS domain-containing protein [Rhodoferax sp.]